MSIKQDIGNNNILEYWKQLQSTRSELEGSLSDKRVELADIETVTGYVSDLRNLLEERPFTERRSFIKSFVKGVEVTGNQMLLIYTIPMQPHEIKGESIDIPLIGHYGGTRGTGIPDFFPKETREILII